VQQKIQTMRKPEEILKLWINAVNHADVDKLIALYDKSAILIPTFSNRVLNSSAKLREYFEKLSSRRGLHIALRENTLVIQELPNNLYVLSGIYTWSFEIDSEKLIFEARFTFVMDLSKDNPIIHHHSSQIPRML
jgi:hypothetical protein